MNTSWFSQNSGAWKVQDQGAAFSVHHHMAKGGKAKEEKEPNSLFNNDIIPTFS